MNLYFAGIDPSFTGTALTILDNEGNIQKQSLIDTKSNDKDPHDIENRILTIVHSLKVLRNFDRVDDREENKCIVYIEDISFGSKGAYAAQMAALNYFIRIFLLENNIEYTIIAPSKLKKFVTGNGKAQKNLMLKEVYKKWGVDLNDDNSADSYALARFALENYKLKRK